MANRTLLFQLSGHSPNAGACRECAESASLGVAENGTAADEVKKSLSRAAGRGL